MMMTESQHVFSRRRGGWGAKMKENVKLDIYCKKHLLAIATT